jgi:soluble lytic murein transglycosylase-like protein
VNKVLQLTILMSLLSIGSFATDSCGSTAETIIAPCVAHLLNGFDVRHQRREMEGENVKLFVSNGSFIVVPRASIDGYEQDTTPAPVVTSSKPLSLEDHVSAASDATGVDGDFLKSVIQSESAGNPRAVSPKGAQGLMQLMPRTASKLGVLDAFDPAANVRGGSQYLRELLDRYHGDAAKALAAYNAGPQRVEQYRGVPPYLETQQYVAKVIRDYNRRKLSQMKPAAKTVKRTNKRTKSRAVATAKLKTEP